MVFDFLGKEPGCSSGVKPNPQDGVGEEGTHPMLMKKGWRPAAMGSPLQGCHRQKEEPSVLWPPCLGLGTKPYGGLGTLSQY